jgi:hypothetical protein
METEAITHSDTPITPTRSASMPLQLAKVLATKGITAAAIRLNIPEARLQIRDDQDAEWRPLFEQTMALFASAAAMPSDKPLKHMAFSFRQGADEMVVTVQVEPLATFITVRPKGHPIAKSEARMLRRLGKVRARG